MFYGQIKTASMDWGSYLKEMSQPTAIGAVGGGIAGAGIGALASSPGNRWKGALGGGAAGAGLGAAGGLFAGNAGADAVSKNIIDAEANKYFDEGGRDHNVLNSQVQKYLKAFHPIYKNTH